MTSFRLRLVWGSGYPGRLRLGYPFRNG